MDQQWFEMQDIRRRKLNNAVWIPVRAAQKESVGTFRTHGSREEFFGTGSIAVPLDKKTEAESWGWVDIGLRHTHKGRVTEGRYVPADVFDGYGSGPNAVVIGLEQDGNSDDPPEWHLHQDFVITLGLKCERDVWLAMDEGYIEVARLRRDDEGRPILLEIRAEHLKDYLCARELALYITSYRNREETVTNASHINWPGDPQDPFRQVSEGDRWEGRRTELEEGGLSAGVLHIGRENVDFQEDVPVIDPSDASIITKFRRVDRQGRKLIRIQGELWRNEWVEPADRSPRVRGDKLPPSVFFVTDATGARCRADKLEGTGGWLWFRPEVIRAVSNRRGGGLRWYTRHTGGVRSSPGSYMHFGVNRLGLVNAYAKDIGLLSEWEQQIWAGFNVGPEGGVSEELLAAQAKGDPANTQAPEEFLPQAFKALSKVTNAKFGFRLFREHADFAGLIASGHRFRATDQPGFFSLAKDLARLVADGVDTAAIQKIVPPPKGERWGSLKSLEKLVALKAGQERARSLLGPLVGIYELRHADAHLASRDIDEAFTLARVDRTEPCVFQGYRLLHSCVSALCSIREVLEEFPDKTV